MTRKNFPVVALIVALLIVTLSAANGLSQGTYPDRPVTVVVIFGGGGMMDITARAICKAAEKELGQPIIVENKPGAGGVVGISHVLKQKPDGYTLGIIGTSQYIQIPNLRKVPYDPFTDTVDIMGYWNIEFGLAVKADAPWNTYEEFIAYAKKNPGKITYATAGVGLAPHICMERIGLKEGIKWTLVPFKSGAEAATSTLGGHTHAVAQGSPEILPHVQAGKLKMLLIISDSRWRDLPNVPTILEKGYDFHAFTSFGFFGPKGLPEPVRQKLEGVFKKAMKDPSFVETMKQFGTEGHFTSGRDYTAKWRSQYDSMGKAMKTLGIQDH